jgi:hypothetical protein
MVVISQEVLKRSKQTELAKEISVNHTSTIKGLVLISPSTIVYEGLTAYNVKLVFFLCLAMIRNVISVKLTTWKSFRKVESSVLTVGRRELILTSSH